MAEVFRAKPLNARDPDNYLAVKRILPHLAEDDEFIAMFIDEARLTVQLRHPNVVQIYELGQFQSSHYIAMEFIAGMDLLALQKHVRRQKTTVDLDMASHIICEVARGMDYVHQKTDENGNPLGIIHRDISPQNVLVSWNGEVRIIDFGIAKAASQSTHTQAGVLKGKYGYMSPEQVRGGVVLDGRSDIFSIGTLFWELLTNRRLFRAANQYEVMAMIGDPEIVAPSEVNPSIPPELDQIVLRALAPEREDRYQRAGELARDLEAYLKNQKPPYHGSQLTTWMRSAFAEEYAQEHEKREVFRQINSAEDVQRMVVAAYGEGGHDGDEEAEEATQIWDVDVLPDVDQDLNAFVDEHTVVQAGGLEHFLGEDWTQDEEELTRVEGEWAHVPDTVEEEIEAVPQGGFEVEPTSLTVDAVPLSLRTSDLGAAPTPPQGVAYAHGSPMPGRRAAQRGLRPGAFLPANQVVSRRRILAALAALGLAMVLLVSVFVVGINEGESGTARGAALVQVHPAHDLEIKIDGAVVGTSSPLQLDDIPPGQYRVSIVHDGYFPWEGEVNVEAGGVAELSVDLGALAELSLTWEGDMPAALELFVEGEPIPVSRTGARVQVPRGEVLIEAYSPEIRPLRQRVRVETGQVTEEVLRWDPPLLVHLAGDPALEVEINGQPLGNLEILLQDLSPRRLYLLKVGDVETVLGYPEIGKDRLTVEELQEFAGRTAEDYGWLSVNTGSGRWHLFIDDVDTGLATPISEEERIPVAAGSRVLGLQRGDQRFHVPVRVHPGETTNARPELRGR